MDTAPPSSGFAGILKKRGHFAQFRSRRDRRRAPTASLILAENQRNSAITAPKRRLRGLNQRVSPVTLASLGLPRADATRNTVEAKPRREAWRRPIRADSPGGAL